ncbi:MAG TPA: dNTP triphosphohydrolase [Anaerohalosphaeraceae bacterium]|nr:dNTP triphosphohydrolase [Anaerohalosphaeraceae bacterium]HOL88776.1 dNTP triphosphohydrolase [Anaerohalosphaeraceae bacterium]HPP55961.1 dNTP triphosphohydrolase [Anaerohalosphaeraceae bacterium]
MRTPPAPYAVTPQNSRGRRVPQPPHPYRGPFERDRDRIIHSAAFRRLEGKTQVFMPGVNDHYRTRMTHSIEVAQIGRTIARALGLNEDLTEAVCLAHDIGHSPFGHTGERVLNERTASFGGFEHNRQALRIVDFLETPYPDFRGLNLMYETRQSLAGHQGPYDRGGCAEFSEPVCCLEGQVANLADRIAYNCHDLEDGIRARLIEEEQARTCALFRDAQEQIRAETIDDFVIRRTRTAKAILDRLVGDVIETSRRVLQEACISSLEEVYQYGRPLIQLSETTQAPLEELEDFLRRRLYSHPHLKAVDNQIEQWLNDLFDRLCGQPEQMPRYFRNLIESEGLQRTVCDYIAGMTDRYALSLLEKV